MTTEPKRHSHPMGRYLTPAAKTAEIRQWNTIRNAAVGIAGAGTPDAEIAPWCDRLNALPGVCTLQSCAGHENGERGRSGHLWLWLDEARARALHKRAFELARRSEIERLSVIYQPWGQEILEVVLQGSPDGQLEHSIEIVLLFLESL